MAKEARGLICAPVSKDIAQRLDLVQMVDDNSDIFGTQFTVRILLVHVDTTTGISAYERTLTAKSSLILVVKLKILIVLVIYFH